MKRIMVLDQSKRLFDAAQAWPGLAFRGSYPNSVNASARRKPKTPPVAGMWFPDRLFCEGSGAQIRPRFRLLQARILRHA
jgi:hypothetical protein